MSRIRDRYAHATPTGEVSCNPDREDAMVEHIHVTRQDAGVWAVRQGDEYIVYTSKEAQAVRVGGTLVDWLARRGQPAELHVERSFAPNRDRDHPLPA
jgi:hypothetical protein